MGKIPNSPRSVTAIDELIAARIKQRRKELGMSQTTLAMRVGVSFQQLQKYENGDNRVSAARLYFLCEALNCRLKYFFEPSAKAARAGEKKDERGARPPPKRPARQAAGLRLVTKS